MNLDLLAPEWAVIALMSLLAAAAVQDALQLRISNLLSGAVLLLAVVVIFVVGPEVRLWENLVVFVATLAVGTFLFSRGGLGGGDVKLLAATGLWFDLEGAFRFLVSTAIAGGLVALIIILIRQFGWSDAAKERYVTLRHRGGIPYGIAIAAGAALAILLAQDSNDRPDPLNNWNVPQVAPKS